MRAIWTILMLTITAAAAGCTTPDEAENDEATPLEDAPEETATVLNEEFEHEFTGAPETATFEVNETTNATIQIRFEALGGAPACPDANAQVRLLGPEGEALVEASPQAEGVTCGGEPVEENLTLAPGEHQVEFAGTGAVRAIVTVVETADQEAEVGEPEEGGAR